jgi:hypothetical protein
MVIGDLEERGENLPPRQNIFSHNELPPSTDALVQYSDDSISGKFPSMPKGLFKSKSSGFFKSKKSGFFKSKKRRQPKQQHKKHEDGDGDSWSQQQHSDDSDQEYIDDDRKRSKCFCGNTEADIFWAGGILVVAGGAITAYTTGLCNIM